VSFDEFVQVELKGFDNSDKIKIMGYLEEKRLMEQKISKVNLRGDLYWVLVN
jgi:hypothetical protein